MYTGVGQAFGAVDLLNLSTVPGALMTIPTNRGFGVQVVEPGARPATISALDKLHVVEEEFLAKKPAGVRTYVSTLDLGLTPDMGWASWGVEHGYAILVTTQPLPPSAASPLVPRLGLISVKNNPDAVANLAAEGSSFAILAAPRAVWDAVIAKPGLPPPKPGPKPGPGPAPAPATTSDTLTYAAVGGVVIALFLLATR